MDVERLKNPQAIFGQDYFNEQLKKIRDIRSSERRFYQQITDIYAECSIDYDYNSDITKDFFTKVQNKLRWAITKQTAAEIIVSRVNHEKEKMGLINWKNWYRYLMIKNALLIFFLFFLQVIAFAQNHNKYSTKAINELQKNINEVLEKEHQSSLMVAIVTKDSIILSKGYGLKNILSKEKATSQTLFPMASITKTFTAIAIMKLVRQGKLSLDDNLSQIAPEISFQNKWKKTNPVKIIHLLEHTSGFDDLRFNTFWNNDMSISELQAIEKCKNSMYCRWRPGEREAYSNIGYNILGYLVEKLSGLKYDEYMKKEILIPIGMTNSNFIVPVKHSNLYADPYEWNGNKYIPLQHLQFYGKGAGALYSSADDMANFVQFLLNNGNNVNLPELHSVVEKMEIPESSTAAQLGLKTGYGKGITLDYLNNKYPFYVHGGTSIGFFSRYAYNRDLNVGFVVCGSNPNPVSDLLMQFLTGSLQNPKPISTIKVDTKILKSFEGYYQLKSPRFEMLNKYLEELFHGYHIEVRGDSLFSYGFKRPDQPLVPVTTNIFKRQNQNAPSFLFTKNNDNIPVLYEWGAYYEKTSYSKILVIRILVLGALVCGILLFLSSIFWLFLALFKKLPWKEFFKRSISSFGVLSFILAFGSLAYMATNVSLMGTVNFFTLTFFFGTVLFAILGIIGSLFTIIRFKNIKNIWTRWYLIITTTWLTALVVFYFHYGWVGLKMWSY